MKTTQFVFSLLLFLILSVLTACSQVGGVIDIHLQPAVLAEDQSEPTAVREIALSFVDSRYNYNWQDYIQFLITPCTTVDGLGGPPKCEAGMDDGTSVEVFPLGGAEGQFATPKNMDNVLQFWIKDLYAVYKVPADAYEKSYWPAGEYALLFERDQNDIPFPITVLVADGKIVRINYHFGITAEDQLASIPVEQVIVSPSSVDAWLYPNGK